MSETVDRVDAAGREPGPRPGRQPVEPPPTRCAFPPADEADEAGVVAVGGDLEPGTLLTAYRSGMFPMPYGRHGELLWWSPDPRAVIPLDGLRVSRSLRRSCRRFEVRIDTAFEAVVEACADPRRPDGWITPAIRRAYVRLHELGWAHSVETWDPDTDRLVGGLYGVAIGGLFAGESMFHHATDASKVALVALVRLLSEDGDEGGGGGGGDRAGRSTGGSHSVANSNGRSKGHDGAGTDRSAAFVDGGSPGRQSLGEGDASVTVGSAGADASGDDTRRHGAGPAAGPGARAVGGWGDDVPRRSAPGRGRLLDVQWLTPHLARLGAVDIPRRRYLELVRQATRLPLPRAFRPPPPPS